MTSREWTYFGAGILALGAGIAVVFGILHWADVWTGKGLIAVGALLAGMGAVLSGYAAVRTSRRRNGNGVQK